MAILCLPRKGRSAQEAWVWGKEHRKGSVTKAKVGGEWRGKKRSRGREKNSFEVIWV